jgi:hypothetical protein
MDDARRIAPLLREQDRFEILTASGEDPEVVLPRALNGSKGIVTFVETPGGDPILISGARPSHPNAAVIWMVGTPLLKTIAFRYAREAHRYVDEWHQQYPLLWNTAWAGNDLHLKWLKFMRFSFIRRVQYRGQPFIEFARLQHVR